MKKDLIIAYFAKKTGFKKEVINEKPISSFPRTDLITLVECIEKRAKKTLCRGIKRPLVWLDELKGITFGDVADYFAGIEGRISVAYSKHPGTEEHSDFKIIVIGRLLENVIREEGKRIDKDSPFFDLTFEDAMKPLDVIYFLEEDLSLMLPGELPFDEETATVEEVASLFADAYAENWSLQVA